MRSPGAPASTATTSESAAPAARALAASAPSQRAPSREPSALPNVPGVAVDRSEPPPQPPSTANPSAAIQCRIIRRPRRRERARWATPQRARRRPRLGLPLPTARFALAPYRKRRWCPLRRGRSGFARGPVRRPRPGRALTEYPATRPRQPNSSDRAPPRWVAGSPPSHPKRSTRVSSTAVGCGFFGASPPSARGPSVPSIRAAPRAAPSALSAPLRAHPAESRRIRSRIGARSPPHTDSVASALSVRSWAASFPLSSQNSSASMSTPRGAWLGWRPRVRRCDGSRAPTSAAARRSAAICLHQLSPERRGTLTPLARFGRPCAMGKGRSFGTRPGHSEWRTGARRAFYQRTRERRHRARRANDERFEHASGRTHLDHQASEHRLADPAAHQLSGTGNALFRRFAVWKSRTAGGRQEAQYEAGARAAEHDDGGAVVLLRVRVVARQQQRAHGAAFQQSRLFAPHLAQRPVGPFETRQVLSQICSSWERHGERREQGSDDAHAQPSITEKGASTNRFSCVFQMNSLCAETSPASTAVTRYDSA